MEGNVMIWVIGVLAIAMEIALCVWLGKYRKLQNEYSDLLRAHEKTQDEYLEHLRKYRDIQNENLELLEEQVKLLDEYQMLLEKEESSGAGHEHGEEYTALLCEYYALLNEHANLQKEYNSLLNEHGDYLRSLRDYLASFTCDRKDIDLLKYVVIGKGGSGDVQG